MRQCDHHTWIRTQAIVRFGLQLRGEEVSLWDRRLSCAVHCHDARASVREASACNTPAPQRTRAGVLSHVSLSRRPAREHRSPCALQHLRISVHAHSRLMRQISVRIRARLCLLIMRLSLRVFPVLSRTRQRRLHFVMALRGHPLIALVMFGASFIFFVLLVVDDKRCAVLCEVVHLQARKPVSGLQHWRPAGSHEKHAQAGTP